MPSLEFAAERFGREVPPCLWMRADLWGRSWTKRLRVRLPEGVRLDGNHDNLRDASQQSSLLRCFGPSLRPMVFGSTICVTGQHREMLDQVNELFGIRPDLDLQVMAKGQSLTHITTTVLERLEDVLRERRPDWVVVQGDTTTAFAAAFAAFLQRIPVAHVEAGLRTGNVLSPWPEEMNRHLTACLTECHFAPLLEPGRIAERGNCPNEIYVTGNTVIDSLLQVRDILAENTALAEQQRNRFDFLDPDRRIILVTGHRRENFDGGLDRVCAALALLAVREDVQIVYPVHLNPAVQGVVKTKLSGVQHVHLLPPLEYLSVRLSHGALLPDHYRFPEECRRRHPL